MFEFFIALFGGLFYSGKYANERAKTKQADQLRERGVAEDNHRKYQWLARVTDRQLERELESFINDISNYEEVWAEVSEAYREMPWETEDFICLFPDIVDIAYGKGAYTKTQKENISKNNRLKALRIMLARRGKLRAQDADTFGAIKSSWTGVPVSTEQEWSKQETKFMLWITSQLAKHGINERLYIKQNTEVYLASKYPIYRGYYVWEPVIPYFYTKYN